METKETFTEITSGFATLPGSGANEDNLSETDTWTFEPLPDYVKEPRAQIAVMITVLVFGVIANLSVIVIVAKNRRLQSTPNIIVVNLAVGDLMCLLINLPFIVDYHLRHDENWIFGEFMCKLAHSSMVTSGCITVYSLLALAIERYLVIAWPLHNRDSNRCVRFSRGCILSPTWQIVVLIWTWSIVVGSPILYTGKLYVYPNGNNVCLFINPTLKIANVYKLFRLLAAFLIPLIVIVAAHCLTARALLKSVREEVMGATDGVCPTGRQTPRVRSRVKLAIVISVLSVMFAIAWLPFYVFNIWMQFHYDEEIFGQYAVIEFYRWKDVPIYMLCCLNPVMLYVLSSRFRGQLLRDLCCCFGTQLRLRTMSSTPASSPTGSTLHSRSAARRSSSTRPEREVATSNEL